MPCSTSSRSTSDQRIFFGVLRSSTVVWAPATWIGVAFYCYQIRIQTLLNKMSGPWSGGIFGRNVTLQTSVTAVSHFRGCVAPPPNGWESSGSVSARLTRTDWSIFRGVDEGRASIRSHRLCCRIVLVTEPLIRSISHSYSHCICRIKRNCMRSLQFPLHAINISSGMGDEDSFSAYFTKSKSKQITV